MRQRIIPSLKAAGNLWIALIVFTAIDAALGLMGSEEGVISTMEIIVEIVAVVLMIATGVMIRKSHINPIAVLGNVMIWVPIVVIVLTLVLLEVLPKDFGEIQQKVTDFGPVIRIEESYSDSTIGYVVAFVIISVLESAIVYGQMASVISMPSTFTEQENDDNLTEIHHETPDVVESATLEPLVNPIGVIDPPKRQVGKVAFWGIVALAVVGGIFAAIVFAGNSKPETSVTDDGDTAFLSSIKDEPGSAFININNPDYNVWLQETDSAQLIIGFEDAYGYSVWEGRGVLQNGLIRTVDRGSLPFDVNIAVVNPYHLNMHYEGHTNQLYSLDYLEQQAESVSVEHFEGLEVQLFEVDGHKFAKTNEYGLLILDDNDTAITNDWFPDSEEGQEATIKFEKDCVTVAYGFNKQIVYKNTEDSNDFIKVEATVATFPYLDKITLDPQKGKSYEASNLFDGDPSTAFAIGDRKFAKFKKETEGHYPRMVGLKTIQQYPIERLVIRNGYTKNDGLVTWNNNARVKNITIMGCYEDSKFADELYSGTLADIPEPQTVILHKTGRYDYYNLIIEDYYPGNKWNDVCISEIEVFGQR